MLVFVAYVGTLQGIPADKVEAAVEEKIEEMGLTQYCERPAGGYSGGNKRKLSVAMAMIGDPQVTVREGSTVGRTFDTREVCVLTTGTRITHRKCDLVK